MTEDEAKTKWCPMVRFVPSTEEHHSATNRGDSITRAADVTVNCIGSACMAWRQTGEGLGPRRVHPNVLADHWLGWTVTDPEPDERGYVGISPPRPPQAEGYCGLAGAPQ